MSEENKEESGFISSYFYLIISGVSLVVITKIIMLYSDPIVTRVYIGYLIAMSIMMIYGWKIHE